MVPASCCPSCCPWFPRRAASRHPRPEDAAAGQTHGNPQRHCLGPRVVLPVVPASCCPWFPRRAARGSRVVPCSRVVLPVVPASCCPWFPRRAARGSRVVLPWFPRRAVRRAVRGSCASAVLPLPLRRSSTPNVESARPPEPSFPSLAAADLWGKVSILLRELALENLAFCMNAELGSLASRSLATLLLLDCLLVARVERRRARVSGGAAFPCGSNPGDFVDSETASANPARSVGAELTRS